MPILHFAIKHKGRPLQIEVEVKEATVEETARAALVEFEKRHPAGTVAVSWPKRLPVVLRVRYPETAPAKRRA